MRALFGCSKLALLALGLGASSAHQLLNSARAEELCSIPPSSYLPAKYLYPSLAPALTELGKYPIAAWYTDRDANYGSTAYKVIQSCKSTATRLNVVVYGLPNKQCANPRGALSVSPSSTAVANSTQYAAFLQDFVRVIGKRKIAYVLEPGAATALASDNASCAEQAGYREDLQTAVRVLSANANADVYLDVGYWSLQSSASTARVADIVKSLAGSGRVRGIALNTANYRSVAELSELCAAFVAAIGSSAYHCVFDTSRNYVAPASNEWCNPRGAGIGQPPTSNTGDANIDHFLWLKPPGESDGRCDESSHSDNAVRGPEAGAFFDQGFASLWNHGYFVDQHNASKVVAANTSVSATPAALATESSRPPATTTPATPACATPEWGSCGNRQDGLRCCPAGFYCQPWSSSFYQCMQTPPACLEQLTDVDFTGASMELIKDSSPIECCVRCAATPACKGYTFVNEDSATCYLKSHIGDARQAPGAVSSTRV